MDPNVRFLAPQKLEIEPGLQSSQITFKHWRTTFLHFIKLIEDNNTAIATASGRAALPVDKFGLLVNYIAPAVYEYIIDKDNYDSAMDALNALYVKSPSPIYARHKLATHKQKSGETIDKFYRDLNVLSKDCEFKEVTAIQHREEAVRDAFISGLLCTDIRQRLLEERELSITQAYNKARSLETAQKQSQLYTPHNEMSQLTISNAVKTSPINDKAPETSDSSGSLNSVAVKTKKCFFCGYKWHPRNQCPARDAECHDCHVKGHYAKVCQGSKRKDKSSVSSAIVSTPEPKNIYLCASHQITDSLSKSIVTVKAVGGGPGVKKQVGSI